MNISVLKLDIEGEEFNSMPEILASNMFEGINQLHLEVLETSINLKSSFATQYDILYFSCPTCNKFYVLGTFERHYL